jgi:hypothetical protein
MYWDVVLPEMTYWPSGVKAASFVTLGDGSKLKPHFCILHWILAKYQQ